MMRVLCLITMMFFCIVEYGKDLNGRNYVTPEDFGCVAGDVNEADGNSFKLQKMVEFAEDEGVKISSQGADKRYYISKSIHISAPITVDFNRAVLVATDTIDMIVISRNSKNNKLYAGNISNLYLDMNKRAKSGIDCKNVVKLRVNDCWAFNVPEKSAGVIVENGGEMFFNNIHVEGGSYGALGFKINTHDCHFSDCVMINCHVAVDNCGSNFFERIHAWMEDGKWIPNSSFFKIRGGGPAFIHQCFSDTYDRSFQIECNTNLFISQFKNFHNRNMWSWRNDIEKIHPELFHFTNATIPNESFITLDNSFIGGLLIADVNRQHFSNIKDHHVRITNSILDIN